MIAITTKSSIKVKPFALRITFDHLFQREIISFAGTIYVPIPTHNQEIFLDVKVDNLE
jgi:hypothetical protein